jgi:hypothetical protein
VVTTPPNETEFFAVPNRINKNELNYKPTKVIVVKSESEFTEYLLETMQLSYILAALEKCSNPNLSQKKRTMNSEEHQNVFSLDILKFFKSCPVSFESSVKKTGSGSLRSFSKSLRLMGIILFVMNGKITSRLSGTKRQSHFNSSFLFLFASFSKIR